jgi:hypothetical protein
MRERRDELIKTCILSLLPVWRFGTKRMKLYLGLRSEVWREAGSTVLGVERFGHGCRALSFPSTQIRYF